MSKKKVVVETPVVEVVAVAKQKGRPVVEGSVRQLKLAAQAAKIAAGNEIKRGRPVSGESARQVKFATRAALIAAGVKVGPGRPKMVKPEVVEVVATIEEIKPKAKRTKTKVIEAVIEAEIIDTPLEVIEGEIA